MQHNQLLACSLFCAILLWLNYRNILSLSRLLFQNIISSNKTNKETPEATTVIKGRVVPMQCKQANKAERGSQAKGRQWFFKSSFLTKHTPNTKKALQLLFTT